MKSKVEKAADLRRHANVMLPLYQSALPVGEEITSPSEMVETQRELQLYQIELDMQNDELHRTQVELATSRARYFYLYESATAGYCTLNEKGTILEDNQAFATLLGETKGNLVRQRFTQFICPEDLDNYYLNRKQLIDSGKLFACELQMVRKNGTTFLAHVGARLARDHNGVIIYLVIVTNITEHKQVKGIEGIIHSHEHLSAGVEDRGTSLGSHRAVPAPLLSKREMEVLHLLGQGLTSKQMAITLNISSRTVDSHRQKIMQKLEISNGPGLVNFAIKHGFDLDH